METRFKKSLETQVAHLRFRDTTVAACFRIAHSNKLDELTALRMAVISLASSLELVQSELEKPRKLTWEINGNLTICPECKRIKEAK